MKRAVVAAIVGTGSGALAHGLAGGSFPTLIGFVPPVVFATLVSLVMLWRYTLPGVVASVLVSQWIFHNTVSWAAGSLTHTHHHAVSTPVIDETAVVMGSAHLLAAALTAGAVVGADRGFAAVSRAGLMVWRTWLWRLLSTTPVLPVISPIPIGAGDGAWIPSRNSTPTPRTLRGPPVFSFS